MMKPFSFGSGNAAAGPDQEEGRGFASGASRREFLKVLAAAGAGAMVPASVLMAQTTPAARAKLGRIDVHHHHNPPEYIKVSQISRRWSWTPATSIEQMDKYGIATSIVSITTPGIWFGNVDQTKHLARLSNEYGAQMVKDYPGRFGLFAALPLPDVDGSLKELEYAYDTLHADGVGFLSSVGGKYLGDPAFFPVLEELNRRKAIVFLHVTVPECCGNLVPGGPSSMSEGDFDMVRCLESLMLNGTFSKFPNIRYIVNHSGGAVPVLAGRIQDRFPKDRVAGVPGGVMNTLKSLYYEVAHATYPAPLGALTKFIPTSQMMFGTDYPAEPIETTTKPLAEFGFSAQDLAAIDRGNAERLFPRLKA